MTANQMPSETFTREILIREENKHSQILILFAFAPNCAIYKGKKLDVCKDYYLQQQYIHRFILDISNKDVRHVRKCFYLFFGIVFPVFISVFCHKLLSSVSRWVHSFINIYSGGDITAVICVSQHWHDSQPNSLLMVRKHIANVDN